MTIKKREKAFAKGFSVRESTVKKIDELVKLFDSDNSKILAMAIDCLYEQVKDEIEETRKWEQEQLDASREWE